MGTFILRRILFSIPVLIACSFIIFTFVSLSGDPLGQLKLNPYLSKQTLQNKIEEKHLDKPIPVRYAYWVKEATTEKFGTSLVGDQPIWPDLRRVIPHTLQLLIPALLLSVLFAVGIGLYSALRQYSVFDYSATTFSFLAYAVPVFWLALMLQVGVVYVYQWTGHRIFPIANLSSVDPGTGVHFWIDRAHHLVLPVFVLMVASIATYSRYMRASMLEVVNSDYVRTARAKGLTEQKVTMKHAFRNALIPLITLVALNFGALLGGAIATETVFSLDGMGLYFVTSLGANDPYPIMAWLMITATMIIIFNLIADIAYGFLDPRVRYD